MTELIFDAAYKPDLEAVKRAGGIAMSYYLTGAYADTCARPPELHQHGLGALANYERAAGELVSCGYGRGVEIGHESAQAFLADGGPAGQGYGIAYSVDVNVSPVNFAAVATAFSGIRAGLQGRFDVHVYGEGALIEYLAERRQVVGVQWLSASTSFPGFDPGSVNVGLVQQVGTTVPGTDLDVITRLDQLGIWWPSGSPHDPRNRSTLGADNMSAAGEATLAKLASRIDNLDALFYNVNGGVGAESMRTVLGRIRAAVNAPATAPPTTDAAAIAAQLVTLLGPGLAHEVVAELGTVLAAAATPPAP